MRKREVIEKDIEDTLNSILVRFETSSLKHLLVQTELLLDIRDLLTVNVNTQRAGGIQGGTPGTSGF